MFHTARALLYKDGIQEKSHLCVVIYLREKYSDKFPISLINSFDNFRIERHETLYGLEFTPTKEDAELAIEDAKKFINVVKKIIKHGAERKV